MWNECLNYFKGWFNQNFKCWKSHIKIEWTQEFLKGFGIIESIISGLFGHIVDPQQESSFFMKSYHKAYMNFIQNPLEGTLAVLSCKLHFNCLLFCNPMDDFSAHTLPSKIELITHHIQSKAYHKRLSCGLVFWCVLLFLNGLSQNKL